MEILTTIVIVFMVTFSIFGIVNLIKQINKVDED
jgi:lipopolysaccharide export LptBFGC system permease protein LptF